MDSISTNVINSQAAFASCSYGSPSEQQTPVEKIEALGLQTLTAGVPYSPSSQIYQETMDFARSKLKEYPETAPEKFSAGYCGFKKTHQPVNQEIALLTALYWDVYFKEFGEAVKKIKGDPWSKKKVIVAADALMKVAYAIGCLTLEDLEPFTQRLSSKGHRRSYARALTEQDSYQYRTFYYCTTVYHLIRGAVESKNKGEKKVLSFPDSDIPQTHSKLFYESDTIQNLWNKLYNDYCDRIRYYVNEIELEKADSRHVNWTRKDVEETSFERTPDTKPT